MNVEQLFEKISRSDELKEQLTDVLSNEDKGALSDWVKRQGCAASLSEIKQYLVQKSEELQENRQLTPEELEAAAGGSVVLGTIAVGIATANLGLAIYGIVSSSC